MSILRSRWASATLPLLPASLLLLHGLLVWAYISPGASTVFCYAQTLATGYGPALQSGAVWSHGFASVLWVLLLAGAELVGLSAILVAKGAGLALAVATLYLLPRVSARLNGRRGLELVDLLPPLLLALNPTMARHAVGGQETSLTLALLALTLALFVAEERRFTISPRRPRDLWSAIPLCLLLLTRPEAPLWFLTLALWRVLARVTARRVPLTSVVWLALPPVVYLLILVGSYALFADPLSGVLTTRQALLETSPGHPVALALGWASLSVVWNHWGIGLPLAALVLLGAFRSLNYWGRGALLGLCLINLAAVTAAGGDSTGRLLLPSLMVAALLAAEGLRSLLRRLQPTKRPLVGRSPDRSITAMISGALVLGLLASPLLRGLRSVTAPASPDSTMEALLGQIEGVIGELGLEPSQVKVLTTRPGDAALRGFQVVDASGLTDPAIRRYNNNRHTRELQQIIFRERRPDVIIEQGLWNLVHAFGAYPEARRQYVPLTLPGYPGTNLSISRELLLEPEPLADERLSRVLGDHLSLVGVRVEPGRLVLLWTASRKIVGVRRAVVRLGDLLLPITVGTRIYPTNRWRPGEVVRQQLPVPRTLPDQSLPLSINHKGRWCPVIQLDGRLLRLDRKPWLKQLQRRLRDAGQETLAELVPMLTRNPRMQQEPTARQVMGRTQRLVHKKLLVRAARQLQLIQHMTGHDPGVQQLARSLAEAAYQRARVFMRRSSWSAAFDTLQAASVAAPGCPWIVRRREEARQRLPAGSHLVEVLELELARRALVLKPSATGLSRVLYAHLALKQYHQVVAAFRAWHQHSEDHWEHTFLVAEAMYQLGWLDRALDMTDKPPPNLAGAFRCPPEYLIRTSFLHDEMRRKLGQRPRPSPLEQLQKGKGFALGAKSDLLAHCARWRPGSPLTVDLFILQKLPEPLQLELLCGPKRQRLTLSPEEHRLRWISKKFSLPPASYRIRLAVINGPSLDLGMVVVGPESTFGFELPRYASWQRQGTAFGRSPVVGRSFRGRRLLGYVGERFADSFASGFDRNMGLIKSPAFRVRKDFLMMLVAGGDDPALGVDLVVEGRKVAVVKGQRSEVMRAVFLPVARYRGRRARVIIRDHDAKDWGHIAVDEIRQVNGPAPGIAP